MGQREGSGKEEGGMEGEREWDCSRVWVSGQASWLDLERAPAGVPECRLAEEEGGGKVGQWQHVGSGDFHGIAEPLSERIAFFSRK